MKTKNNRHNKAITFTRSTLLLLVIMTAVRAEDGIMLGNTFVPKNKIWVYLLFGNSPLSGRDPARDTSTVPNAWNYVLPTPDRSTPPDVHTWVPAKSPLHIDNRSEGCQDPGTPFAQTVALKLVNQDNYIGIMQMSNSALFIKDFMRGTAHYDALINEAMKLKHCVTFAGIISMIGLLEAQYARDLANYVISVNKVITQIREDLALPELPFIYSGFPVNAKGKYDTTLSNIKKFLALEPQIPQVITNCAFIPTHGLTIYQNDNNLSHYDSASCFAWGKRTVDTVIAHGWAPLTTTPIRFFKAPERIPVFSRPDYNIYRVFYNGRCWPEFISDATGSIHLFAITGRQITIPGSTARSGTGMPQDLVPGTYIIRYRTTTR